MQLGSPKLIKEVQQLTGKVASLNRFIARSADRNLPFFKVLRKVNNFEWNDQCEKALQELKCSVLVREEDGKLSPIYYVSKMLQEAEKKLCRNRIRPPEKDERWLLHVDGSSTSKNGGAGIYLQGPDGVEIEIATRLNFPEINNEAEYEALIQGLQMAWDGGVRQVDVYTDSQLVAMQEQGTYETREWSMTQYLVKVKEMMKKFDRCTINQIPRDENARTDALSKFGSLLEGVKERKITMMVKSQPVIDEKVVHAVEVTDFWRTPFVRYLKYGELPSDAIAAKRLQFKENRFTMLGDDLYKRTPEGILLKCLDGERSQYVMKEIHEGSCRNHSGGRSLAQKILRQGYFWPIMVEDAKEFSKKCESCHKYAGLLHSPATLLDPLKVACHFNQWGIDILGPFSQAVAQKKFLIIVVEYFSKWVEAKALAKISEKEYLKTRLEGAKGAWVKEFLGVLWAYRTTHEQPLERSFDLTVIEEGRDRAYAKILRYKIMLTRNYNRRVRPRSSQVDDLVLKKVEVSKHVGKLDPTWEGPYKVVEIRRKATYILQDLEGKNLPRSWNVHNLKKFYA
ncbi:uncharacterized protein LOC105160144 [Sesamum indicum]|uniref:Uncharacterized protein LOC105160144 n=1 Tax=Sesamum indicum TaxID=4182 RepID=A0A6I9T193_SESIN|nr:uncharacterized protein LOC105160144 [Sesamum indicum]